MRKLVITRELTNRDAISLDKYFSDICSISLLNPAGEVHLCKRIKEGDENALKTLINSNLRFVVSVAKKYQHQGLPLSDLINEANLGLIEAAKRFDETKGFKFITYAVWWIRQSIIRAIINYSRVIRLPANRFNSMNQISGVFNTLQQELNRDPNSVEISNHLDSKFSDTTEVLELMNNQISLDAPSDQSGETIISDHISDVHSLKPDGELEEQSIKYEINRALKNLSHREAEVLKLLFGLESGQSMSLQSVGHHFSLSEERVRQIRSNALNKLRNPGISKKLFELVAD
ncbi:MAG: RNA polymerase sigma factor RpoD/SigA [Bacteroidales bacterium]|nr:RNA polymerase sigma factor RpoD/SigA [Bacteroidales bacterium]